MKNHVSVSLFCECGVGIGGYVDTQAVGVMIGYRLKRTLVAEVYAAKRHYNWVVVLAGGRRGVFCLLEGGFEVGSLSHRSLRGLIWDEF